MTRDVRILLVTKDSTAIILGTDTLITRILIVDHVVNHVKEIFRDTERIRVGETFRVEGIILIKHMVGRIQEIKGIIRVKDLTEVCQETGTRIDLNLEIGNSETIGIQGIIQGTEIVDRDFVEETS